MITFTPAAIAQWQLEHPDSGCPTGPMVRLSVVAGGCAGLKYVLEPVSGSAEGDEVFAHEGLAVVCAPDDLARLTGLRVDYVDAMVGGGYRFENPNAGRSCGCGASFGA
ncbi:MAG: iron-sulfur cluster assembly accessory protein [bacterium]|nr:iron-sulfur cluster assembly accessory protein [bacterium]